MICSPSKLTVFASLTLKACCTILTLNAIGVYTRCNLVECENEFRNVARKVVQDVLSLNHGNDVVVVPLHSVFRHAARGETLNVAHVDFMRTQTLEELCDQWWSTWGENVLQEVKLQSPTPEEFCSHYSLLKIVTVWTSLTRGIITDHPLLLADPSSVLPNHLLPYTAGSSRKVSVGVCHNRHQRWVHIQEMKWGESWVFDTQVVPHVAVTSCGSFAGRRPVEVRSLVLKSKG